MLIEGFRKEEKLNKGVQSHFGGKIMRDFWPFILSFDKKN